MKRLKTIVDKNGYSIVMNTDKIECIKTMVSKIIICFDSGNYLTILGCREEEQKSLLEQLWDEETNEIHTQYNVKFVHLQGAMHVKNRQDTNENKDNLWD